MFLNEKMKVSNLDIVKLALNTALEILNDKSNNLDNIESIKNIFIEYINKV
jgi:hypothetical protein